MNLAWIEIVVEAEAQLQEGSLELFRQRGIGGGTGDAAPGGAVQGNVARGELEDHLLDAAVGIDLETDTDPALFVERRPSRFGNDGNPASIRGLDDPPHVRAKVDPHGVAEDIWPH